MTGEEHIKDNGDVVWRIEFFHNDMTNFALAVLTVDTLFIDRYIAPPKAIVGWNKACAKEDYLAVLSSNCVAIPLADITRVEYGEDSRDLLCVIVFWSANGRSRKQTLEAPDELEIYWRLREHIAPTAKFRKERASYLSRLWTPLMYMALTAVSGSCCCGLTFLPNGGPRNPNQKGFKTRAEAAGELITQLGPWGISAIALLILLALLIWTVARFVDRPVIRYFEPRRVRARRD
jgi:hypothetical protein